MLERSKLVVGELLARDALELPESAVGSRSQRSPRVDRLRRAEQLNTSLEAERAAAEPISHCRSRR
jgi:hypothetical protein